MPSNPRHLPVVQRCSGDCCERVRIPVSPVFLHMYPARWGDGHVLSGMLRCIGWSESWGQYEYECLHWDPVSGDCGIYGSRPTMCAEYPYGGQCEYAGCTDPQARMVPEVRERMCA